MNVDITGVILPEFVKKVYELSSPQGLGVLHYRPEGLTNDEINEILDTYIGDKRICLSMDYVSGRSCKMTVFKDENSIFIRFPWFDHTNEQFIELLKAVWPKGKPFPKLGGEHGITCNCSECQIKNKGGGEKLKEEKLEQLRKVFKEIIEDVTSLRSDAYLQRIADKLVYEVKIRINNK